MRFFFLCLLLAPSLVFAKAITPERIFSSPALFGDSIRAPKLSPDGQQITFLKGKENDFERLDLWTYDIATGKRRQLFDSTRLNTSEVALSDEEKARRERLRLNASGIVSYSWSKDGKALLFPLAGDVFYWRLGDKSVKRLLATPEFETDIKLSPKGNFISYIREQNLFIMNIETRKEQQLTFDGAGPIKYGMAEFIAQEELNRMTGYWWSKDEQRIAFTKVDESPVELVTRNEIYAEEIKTIKQRYPFAGRNNVLIELGVIDIQSKKLQWLDLGKNKDIYLARVKWTQHNDWLSFQVLSREQKVLSLMMADLSTGKQRVLLQETSNTWINLHDDLHFLKDNQHFLWLSERDGYQHVYLFDMQGNSIKQLTQGAWVVDEIEYIDQESKAVYFTGRKDTPLERHLYKVNYQKYAGINRISKRSGFHNIEFGLDGQFYLNTFSSSTELKQLSLHKKNGSRVSWLSENKVNARHPFYDYQNDWIKPEFGSFITTDNMKLYYRLYKPAKFDSTKRYPAIVFVYGGPHVQLVTNSWGRSNAVLQYLAQQGYVVFTVDNRGSSHRGKAFEEPIYKAMGGIEVADQIEGVKYLRNQPWIDKNRIGVHGHSYGGYMTLMLMFKAGDYFKAGVSGAPVTDWRLYDTGYTERYMGNPNQVPEAYERASVFPYAKDLQGALLIYHGMADDNVLFKNSTKLYQLLQDNNLPFFVMDYPGKKHSIRGKKTQMHRLNMIKNFFDLHLKSTNQQ